MRPSDSNKIPISCFIRGGAHVQNHRFGVDGRSVRLRRLVSELYAEAVERFGQKGMLELATVMGDYVMAGMVLTAIDQQLAEGQAPLMPAR